MARDGAHWRRLVPSPEPKRICEIEAIERLIDGGFVVICAGDGGIPVVRRGDGEIAGVDGVIDKDLTSALLAESIGADCLMMLTDVEAVQSQWGTPEARDIRVASPEALAALTFPPGSMGPKIAAACRFARGPRRAFIGSLDQTARILGGASGTMIASDANGIAYYPH